MELIIKRRRKQKTQRINNMTLPEAKNKVAQKYGFEDWWSLDFMKTNLSQEAIRDEVSIVYAQSKWDEACEEQRTACAIACNTQTDGTYYFKSICAPKPEFKP